MANAVVILGAGASADFGVPTLRTMFKDRQARAYVDSHDAFRVALERYFWTPRGHSLDSSEQSLTIEEMLTILRDWELEKVKSGISQETAVSYTHLRAHETG